jgi:putative oxidoreductase
MKSVFTKARILIALRVTLILAFGIAGAAKLAGAATMVAVFDSIGVGQWFRYVTGGIELIGALSLMQQSYSLFGSLLLACTMVGAIATHVFIIGGSPVPAVVLGVLCFLTAYILWPSKREKILQAIKADN